MEFVVYRKHTAYKCQVDDADYPVIKLFSWHVVPSRGKFYLASAPSQGTIKLHRMLMGFPEREVDHRNGDGLDNRRENLRPATHQQNCCNRKKKSDGITSKFKGVSYKKSHNKWVVQLNGKHVGIFDNELQAAGAYNLAALAEHGEFALLNKIGD